MKTKLLLAITSAGIWLLSVASIILAAIRILPEWGYGLGYIMAHISFVVLIVAEAYE